MRRLPESFDEAATRSFATEPQDFVRTRGRFFRAGPVSILTPCKRKLATHGGGRPGIGGMASLNGANSTRMKDARCWPRSRLVHRRLRHRRSEDSHGAAR